MLLDKKFKSEQVRLGAEAAAKLGTRSNRYETLLKQRHVQVRESRIFSFLWTEMQSTPINVQGEKLIRNAQRNATQPNDLWSSLQFPNGFSGNYFSI